MNDNRKVIYFLGPKYSGSTFIYLTLSYNTRSFRAFNGTHDNKDGDGALVAKKIKSKVHTQVDWIPEKFINKIKKFNDVYLLNSHWIKDLDINFPNKKQLKLSDISDNKLDSQNLLKIQIIRNPIDVILSSCFYDGKTIQDFKDKDLNNETFLKKYFEYYFSEKKGFEDHPIKNFYNISFNLYSTKKGQKQELENITKMLNIYDKKFLDNYINNDYEEINEFIKTVYKRIRGLQKTNTEKYKGESILTPSQVKFFKDKIDFYCKYYKLSETTVKAIYNEI